MAELLQTQHVRVLQRCSDIRHHEDVVEIKPPAERDQRDEAAMKSTKWQPLYSGSDGMLDGHRQRRIHRRALVQRHQDGNAEGTQ